ncbi:hypothetical protein HYPSUDRAFT_174115 [Hypholoma sublateritium FD-334 SS-4]|uniref:G-protein coupled receptors family 1 profile domain-containing protein n=1 Tax=Hypholoma sublateritium (strain FD-334 SS-4) TaxID=945553 RepID=A0A0D2KFS8_HYPSF|nr:hypothetical protein HYPSUDRAFT_174115 [Hypholoma sublateritium FD-334 SS-4]
MFSSNSTAHLPNPLTPLAFLSPEEAYLTTVTTYASVAALAVLLWDILDNVAGDYRLVKSQLNISLIVYFASRIGAIGYLVGSVLFSTTATGNCVALITIAGSWCPLAFPCSAFLFLLRLRAVYNRDRVIVTIFSILWLGLLASSFFVPLGIQAAHIGPTKYCTIISVKKSAILGHLTPLIYDTLVFVAISWRLCRIACARPSGPQERLKVVLFGRYLPAFTKSILLDGQIYYLTTMIGGIAVAVLELGPGIPIPLKYLPIDPYIAIVNIMACRVYRRTKLGLIRESEISTTAIDKKHAVHAVVFKNVTVTSGDTIRRRASFEGSASTIPEVEKSDLV